MVLSPRRGDEQNAPGGPPDDQALGGAHLRVADGSAPNVSLSPSGVQGSAGAGGGR